MRAFLNTLWGVLAVAGNGTGDGFLSSEKHNTADFSYSISLPPTLFFFLKDFPWFRQLKGSNKEKAFWWWGSHCGCTPGTIPIQWMWLSSPQERKGNFYDPLKHLPPGQYLSSVAWEDFTSVAWEGENSNRISLARGGVQSSQFPGGKSYT